MVRSPFGCAGVHHPGTGQKIQETVGYRACVRYNAVMAVGVAELMAFESRASSLTGLISAATAELVELLADALERDVWHGYGIKSPEHWASVRFGVSAAHASRLVAAAGGLREL